MAKQNGKGKPKGLPRVKALKKDPGVPKFAPGVRVGLNREGVINPNYADHSIEAPTQHFPYVVDPALGRVDNSVKAYMREFRKVLDLSDVVIQVLDARDPLGCRSKLVETAVRSKAAEGKRLILVLNKIDLVPRENVEAWLKYLRHDFPTIAFKSSTQEQRSNLGQKKGSATVARAASSDCLGAESLVQLLKNYSRSLNLKTSVTVGVVGFPNVGKSSVINSLKRSRVCGVAATPGHTKVAQEVVLDKNVKLLDCPGVVFATSADLAGRESEAAVARNEAEVLLRNVVKVELVEDPISPVGVILSRCQAGYLQQLYQIPAFSDLNEFLVMVALTRGRLGKGGKPDLDAAARSVLRDWNTGKILYHTEPPKVHPSSMPSELPARAPGSTAASSDVGQSSIVKEWAPAFDLAGLFDQADSELFGAQAHPDGDLPESMVEDVQPPASLTLVAKAKSPSGSIPLSAPLRKRHRSVSVDSDEEDSIVLPRKGPPQATERPLKRLKLREEKKVRIDSHESSTLAVSNPLNRANLRRAAKQARRNELRSTGGAFALADQLSGLGVI